MAQKYCTIPQLSAALPATASNVIMVTYIYKYGNQSYGAGYLFTLIGVSNILFCTFMSIEIASDHGQPSRTLKWFQLNSTMISFCLQLGFNIALAFERQQVTSKPLQYHTTDAKKQLERKLCLVVVILSLIIGFLSTTMAFLFNIAMILYIPVAVTRIAGYVILCVLCFKQFRSIEKNEAAIVETLENAEQTTTTNKEIIMQRKRKLVHTRKFLIGITTSYLLFNLPTMITFLAVDATKPCDSVKGIASSVSSTFSFLNCVFDTVWYFYMDRRSRNQKGN